MLRRALPLVTSPRLPGILHGGRRQPLDFMEGDIVFEARRYCCLGPVLAQGRARLPDRYPTTSSTASTAGGHTPMFRHGFHRVYDEIVDTQRLRTREGFHLEA